MFGSIRSRLETECASHVQARGSSRRRQCGAVLCARRARRTRRSLRPDRRTVLPSPSGVSADSGDRPGRDYRRSPESLFGPSHKAGQQFDFPPELREADSPTSPLSTNNFGFQSPYQFPIVKRDREFIVGIFGGSVSVFFCLAGADRLVADLQQHEFFKDRTIVPLCMAHEGYKQPQQLLVLSYFLSIGQTFDLVVNIDGFNEAALSPLNDQQGIDISMPSVSHLLPLINLIDQGTLTPEKLQSLAAISDYKQQVNRLADILQRNRLASVGLLLGQYRAMIVNRYDEESRRFAALQSVRADQSLVSAIPPTEERAGTMLYDDIARQWAQGSVLDARPAGGARHAIRARSPAESIQHFEDIHSPGSADGAERGLAFQGWSRAGLSGAAG